MNSTGIPFAELIAVSRYVAIVLTILAVVIAIAGYMLIVAGRILRFPKIELRNALRATATAAITLLAINFSAVANFFAAIGFSQSGRIRASDTRELLMMMASPSVIQVGIVLGILLTALIYQRLLPSEKTVLDEEDELIESKKLLTLTFGQAIPLAAVQFGLLNICLLLFGFAFGLVVDQFFGF